MTVSQCPNSRQNCHVNVKDVLSLIRTDQDVPAPIWVAAVALVNRPASVLMQERPLGTAHAGLWEFPGGKLEPGETPEAAAVRELEEELGILVDPADLVPVSFACGQSAGGMSRPLVILLFACRRWRGSPEPHAAARIDWVAPSALAALRMPPLDYPLAEALVAKLQKTAI